MIGLIDCNSFYASCEEIFNPSLRNRPVVVLSNNDGCIVARSKKAKAIGIPMGAPAFKYKTLFETQKVVCLSSNYALYGDISNRVMQCIEEEVSDMQIYSIDEAFVRIDDINQPFKIKKKVMKWVGIPVSIGIGPTKTLAKVANDLAKKKGDGILFFTDPEFIRETLSNLEVEEVWGIGRRLGERLRSLGVRTALEFRELNDEYLRKEFTVVGLRMAHELRGISCMDMDEVQEPKKSILCSRSFTTPIADLDALGERVAAYAARAAEKLRDQESVAHGMEVFVRTNPFNDTPYYANRIYMNFPEATDYTPTLISWAKEGLKSIYREGYLYKKAGIMLSNLSSKHLIQRDFFDQTTQSPKKNKLMRLMDKMNQTPGGDKLFFAAQGTIPYTHRDNITPRYTSSWKDLLKVKS